MEIQTYHKKQEKSHISTLNYFLKELEKPAKKAQSQQMEGNNKDQKENK